MRFSLVLLALAAVSTCGPLPQRTGIVHHHHHHHHHAKRALEARSDSKQTSLTSLISSTTTLSGLSGLSQLSLSKLLNTLNLQTSSKSTSDSSSSSASKTSKSSILTTSTESTSSSSDTDKLLAMTTTTGMPTVLTKAQTTTSTSYSYSISVPPSEQTGSYDKNPYVVNSLAPDNIVFIGVGAATGALLFAAIVVRIASWCISRRKAKLEKEVYFHNYSHKFSSGSSVDSASFLLGTSSQLSFFEKSSNSSLNMLEKQSLNWDVSGQGRTYRDMLAHMERRGSMTFGPVLELMMTSSRSNLELPMLHSQETSLRILLTAPSVLDMPVYADLLSDSRTEQRSEPRSELRKERPPSQLLDELLEGVHTLDPGMGHK